MCAFDSWFASFHATFSNKLCCIKTGEKVKCRNTCSTYRAIAFAIAIADPGHALHVTSHIGHYTAGLLLYLQGSAGALSCQHHMNVVWHSRVGHLGYVTVIPFPFTAVLPSLCTRGNLVGSGLYFDFFCFHQMGLRIALLLFSYLSLLAGLTEIQGLCTVAQ